MNVPGDEDNIPLPLRERLVTLKPTLERQGVIQRHREVYRVRYRFFDLDLGCIVHRSLTVGDEPTAAAVKTLLEQWRDAWSAQETAKEYQRNEGKRLAAADRLELKILYAADGFPTDWRRRQLRAWRKSLADDPRAAMRFAVTQQFPARNPCGRRPQSLW